MSRSSGWNPVRLGGAGTADPSILLLIPSKRNRFQSAIEANEELRERDALKSIGMAAAMVEALGRRDVTGPTAQVAAEIAVLAFRIGYTRWADPSRDDDPGELATHTRAALDELRAAAAELR